MTQPSRGITEMSEAEFDATVEAFIERGGSGGGDVPADLFLDLLFDRVEAKQAEPVTLEIHITEYGLQITPDREGSDVVVRGNEVLVGGRRLLLQLASAP